MYRRLLMLTAIAALHSGVSAQINSPAGDGYLLRAQQMMQDANYVGTLDQLQRAWQLPLTAQQAEEALLLQGRAQVHTDKPLAIATLEKFLTEYPASQYRLEALLALGDCYYGSDYEKALSIYKEINPYLLKPALSADLRYRTAYCYLQQQNYQKAKGMFAALADSKKYSKASTFYCGYIAYVGKNFNEATKLLKAARSNVAPGNMADYYLAQIDYSDVKYQQALASAKSLLQRKGIANEYVAEAYRIAGESAYHLDNRTEALKYLKAYTDMTADAQPSALYILGLYAYDNGDYAKAVEYFTPATEFEDAMSQSAYLYIGQSLLKDGDVDGAVLAFDKALKLDFDPEVQETAYYNYAVASMQGGKVPFGNSITIFENFIKKYPQSTYAPEAQKYVITAYVNNRDYESALASINAMARPSAATTKTKQKVLYMLGAKTLAAGNHKQALTYLKEAKTLARQDAAIDKEVDLLLGEAYYRNGELAAAANSLLQYLDKSKESDTNRSTAYYDLGYVRFAQGKYQDAATNFRRLLARPGSLSRTIIADAYARLGDCLFYDQNFAEAALAYDNSYSSNPKVGDYALFQKALMEGYQRNHSTKISLLKQLQSTFPQSSLIPDALLETTESYIQLGNNAEAIATYRRLVSAYPNTEQGRQGYLQMALTLLNSGKKQEAIEAYKSVIEMYPSSDEASQAVEQLKRVYATDGRIGEFMTYINNVPDAPKMDVSEADNLTFEVAEKEYITEGKTDRLTQYLAEFPAGAGRMRALSYLMEAASAADDSDKAYEYASTLVADYPDNALSIEARAVKGTIEMEQGKGALALRTFRDMEQRASKAEDLNYARINIAECALAAGNYDDALQAAESVLASANIDEADRIRALYLKGKAHENFGNDAEAREAWQEAAAYPAELYGIRSAYDLAENYFKNDNLKKAEQAAKAVTEADTPHQYWMARGFILLSDVYAKQGNNFKAQQYLKSLRDNYPGNESDIFKMIDQRIK